MLIFSFTLISNGTERVSRSASYTKNQFTFTLISNGTERVSRSAFYTKNQFTFTLISNGTERVSRSAFINIRRGAACLRPFLYILCCSIVFLSCFGQEQARSLLKANDYNLFPRFKLFYPIVYRIKFLLYRLRFHL